MSEEDVILPADDEEDTTPISAGGATVGPDGAVRTPEEAKQEREDRLDGSWREQQ